MSEHTPGPWRLQKMRQEGMFSIGMGTFYATGLIGEANARLIAQAWTIPALRGHLEQALRQWSMYAEFEEIDLTDEKSPEAEMYRAAKSALKLGQEND